jgi:hypothetical protein
MHACASCHIVWVHHSLTQRCAPGSKKLIIREEWKCQLSGLSPMVSKGQKTRKTSSCVFELKRTSKPEGRGDELNNLKSKLCFLNSITLLIKFKKQSWSNYAFKWESGMLRILSCLQTLHKCVTGKYLYKFCVLQSYHALEAIPVIH